MPRFLNPPNVPTPQSRYSQAVALGAPFKRVIISGQVGVKQDGTLVDDIEPQLEQAWDNLLACVEAAGLAASDIVKVTTYVTVPGTVTLTRAVRERKLGRHAPASTYLEVAGLASPLWLCEIEAEAVREAGASGAAPGKA
jgi:2-iminobutanoate/2-iminopropanoate deaminase